MSAPAEAGPKISISDVSKGFDGGRGWTPALEKVSLQIVDREFVCLLGPSGCGKSTLLNLLAGLDRPDEGTISVDGEIVTGPGHRRLMMFQEPALFPWLDVRGNVMFGLNRRAGKSAKERGRTADEFIGLVGLEKFAHAHVHELSGGMKQRAALARALAPNPRVLLMDEPFAALDTITREQLYGDLQRLWEARNVTIVFVTHNVREAVCLGDRVVVMSPHPGRIAGEFRIDLPRPRDMNAPEVAERAVTITDAMKESATRTAEAT